MHRPGAVKRSVPISGKENVTFWKKLFGGKESPKPAALGGKPTQTSVTTNPQFVPSTAPPPSGKESAQAETQTGTLVQTKQTNTNLHVATGRSGDMPIYEIDPQSWAHGAEVLEYLFVDSHCRELKDNQDSFLGCDGVIYSVEGNDVQLCISKREVSPWLRCSPGPYADFSGAENPLRVYPLRSVKDWQWRISEDLEALSRSGYSPILPEQLDLARNDARTFSVPLSSLNLELDEKDYSQMRFSLPDFPGCLSGIQSKFVECVLGRVDVIKAVIDKRGNDWRDLVITFPSKSKIVDDLERARSCRADIPAVGYGLGIGVERNYTMMNIKLAEI